MLDENEDVKDKNGAVPTFPTTGLEDSTFGFNYRAEPLRNRLVATSGGRPRRRDRHAAEREGHRAGGPLLRRLGPGPGQDRRGPGRQVHVRGVAPAVVGCSATRASSCDARGRRQALTDLLIPKAYKGDPIRYHVIHPGAKEATLAPAHEALVRRPGQQEVPAQRRAADRPGRVARVLDIEGGAGCVQETIGDSIFHCHLYPHFAQGFWGTCGSSTASATGVRSTRTAPRSRACRSCPTAPARRRSPTRRIPASRSS